MTDLSTPAHLRALVEALPELIRGDWSSRAGAVYHGIPLPHRIAAECTDANAGHLIATVASPPVVLALADLFEQWQRLRDLAHGLNSTEAAVAIARCDAAFTRLEAAIHRTPEGAA